MELRRLGRSGVRVSAIGLGGNQFGGRVDDAGTRAIVDAAQELGINHIDTAEAYSDGGSEMALGKALKGRRHDFVVATKTGTPSQPPGRLSRRALTTAIEGSLRRLDTDHIDVYYCHFPDPGTPLEETLRALDDAVRAGKILYPALSNHPAWMVATALAIADRQGGSPPILTQDAYNLIDRRVEAELLPALRHHGLGLVPFFPLAGGFLTGKYRPGEDPPPGVRGHQNQRFQEAFLKERNFQRLEEFTTFAQERGRTVRELAIAFLLAEPVVASVIVGATSAAQVRSNAEAAGWTLSPGDRQALGGL